MSQWTGIDANELQKVLTDSYCKGASATEMVAFVSICNIYKMNPVLRQIHIFKGSNGAMVPVIGVDGFLSIAINNPQYDGMDISFEKDEDGNLFSCTCIIHRKDQKHPVPITELFEECVRATPAWKMKRRMLRNRAMCQAIRVAFGVCGVYEQDEAETFAVPLNQIKPIQRKPQDNSIEAEVVSSEFEPESEQEMPKFDMNWAEKAYGPFDQDKFLVVVRGEKVLNNPDWNPAAASPAEIERLTKKSMVNWVRNNCKIETKIEQE